MKGLLSARKNLAWLGLSVCLLLNLFLTESIKAPVLIIVGSKDPYVSPDLCDEAYRTLSNKKDSELVIVDGASHAMLMERPYYKLFRERVLSFLNKG